MMLGIVLISLLGCIEYREEIWLENDYSGTMMFEISLPPHTSIDDEEISELSIVSLCDSIEGVTVTASNTCMIDEITWIQIHAEFDNILLLNNISNEWFGHIYLDIDENGDHIYKRIITMSDTIDTSDNQIGKVLKYAVFGQYSWIYTIHFPDKLYESNAPLMRTDTLTNTVTWEYNLASLINDQKIMTSRYRYRKGLKGYLKNLFKR